MRRGLIVMITWWDEAWASLNEGWGRVKSLGPMNSSMIVFRIFDLYNRIGVMFKINEACVIGNNQLHHVQDASLLHRHCIHDVAGVAC